MSSFYDHPTTADRKHSECKVCRKEYVKTRREKIKADPVLLERQRIIDNERQKLIYKNRKWPTHTNYRTVAE